MIFLEQLQKDVRSSFLPFTNENLYFALIKTEEAQSDSSYPQEKHFHEHFDLSSKEKPVKEA